MYLLIHRPIHFMHTSLGHKTCYHPLLIHHLIGRWRAQTLYDKNSEFCICRGKLNVFLEMSGQSELFWSLYQSLNLVHWLQHSAKVVLYSFPLMSVQSRDINLRVCCINMVIAYWMKAGAVGLWVHCAAMAIKARCNNLSVTTPGLDPHIFCLLVIAYQSAY